MPGLAEALVGVTIVHGDKVHVTEDETAVVILLQGLRVAYVEELGSVEDFVIILRPVNMENNTSDTFFGGVTRAIINTLFL